MNASAYQPPIDRLLSYGDLRQMGQEYPNYVEELSLSSDQIPDLIRLATDMTLLTLEDPEDVIVWAPIHAMRVLGQLRAEAAIDPLLSLLKELSDDDWFRETLTEVLGMIGAAAIPALSKYLADPAQEINVRLSITASFEKIGEQHPEARDACVAALMQQLRGFNRNPLELNGFLVNSLVQLQALEALPLMEQAFAARRVDLSIIGTWDDVQVEFGLKPPDELPTQRKFQPFARIFGAVDFSTAAMPYEAMTTGFGQPVSSPNPAKSSKNKKKKKK
ncbi:MAG: HEAT repeat domain-containing protein [Scytolyngbya sp. HA4215-MV1]|jgi:hypothetical protein|nr:HEAT repeat domain-containing protein [Scytolyngbya sp. HA4215-MV1]